MSKQIIKQSDGLYCIFSTIVDNLTEINCTKEEVLEEFQFRYGVYGKEKAEKIINQLENGEKPYFQFTMSFQEMLETVERIHGKEEVTELLQSINCSA